MRTRMSARVGTGRGNPAADRIMLFQAVAGSPLRPDYFALHWPIRGACGTGSLAYWGWLLPNREDRADWILAAISG